MILTIWSFASFIRSCSLGSLKVRTLLNALHHIEICTEFLFGCFVLRITDFFSDNFTFEVNTDVMLGEVAPILWCNAPAHTVRLTRSLSVQVCGIGLLLPPKKLIGNMDRDFIAERQRGLQAYLDSVTQHPVLSSSLPVKKFLDSNSYSANYTGMFALYHNIVIYILSI